VKRKMWLFYRKEKTKRKQLYFLLDMLYCIMKYRRRGKEGMGNGE